MSSLFLMSSLMKSVSSYVMTTKETDACVEIRHTALNALVNQIPKENKESAHWTKLTATVKDAARAVDDIKTVKKRTESTEQ